MKVVITGHRPQHLECGFSATHPQRLHIEAQIRAHLRSLKSEHPDLTVYTGMALGVDQWCARVCVEEGIDFVAVIPCATQPTRWSAPQQTTYRALRLHRGEVWTQPDRARRGRRARRVRVPVS